jgi:hypothetical protein
MQAVYRHALVGVTRQYPFAVHDCWKMAHGGQLVTIADSCVPTALSTASVAGSSRESSAAPQAPRKRTPNAMAAQVAQEYRSMFVSNVLMFRRVVSGGLV